MTNGSDGSLSQADIDALLSGEEDADSAVAEESDASSLLDDAAGGLDLGADLDDLSSLMGTSTDESSTASSGAISKATRPKSLRSNELENTENMELLLDVKMNLSVEIGRTKMQIEDVLGLGSGAIVELDKLNGELVDILVNNRLIARGEVVAVDENFGVKIVSIIDPEERFKIEL